MSLPHGQQQQHPRQPMIGLTELEIKKYSVINYDKLTSKPLSSL